MTRQFLEAVDPQGTFFKNTKKFIDVLIRSMGTKFHVSCLFRLVGVGDEHILTNVLAEIVITTVCARHADSINYLQKSGM